MPLTGTKSTIGTKRKQYSFRKKQFEKGQRRCNLEKRCLTNSNKGKGIPLKYMQKSWAGMWYTYRTLGRSLEKWENQ